MCDKDLIIFTADILYSGLTILVDYCDRYWYRELMSIERYWILLVLLECVHNH